MAGAPSARPVRFGAPAGATRDRSRSAAARTARADRSSGAGGTDHSGDRRRCGSRPDARVERPRPDDRGPAARRRPPRTSSSPDHPLGRPSCRPPFPERRTGRVRLRAARGRATRSGATIERCPPGCPARLPPRSARGLRVVKHEDRPAGRSATEKMPARAGRGRRSFRSGLPRSVHPKRSEHSRGTVTAARLVIEGSDQETVSEARCARGRAAWAGRARPSRSGRLDRILRFFAIVDDPDGNRMRPVDPGPAVSAPNASRSPPCASPDEIERQVASVSSCHPVWHDSP